jgi:uncharacterized protein YjbI with pentapeptide repeats
MSAGDARQDGTKRAVPNDFNSWNAYWIAQGMPWRTEPEIDAERQRFLAERRTIQPDIEHGIYPFKDIQLTRADVEWLLATHESGGMHGPVDWADEGQRAREGLDLRGARVQEVNLRHLPLAGLQGGLPPLARRGLTTEQLSMAAADLRRTDFTGAQMEGADLSGAQLQGAILRGVSLHQVKFQVAHLEQAKMRAVNLHRADFREAHLERANLDLAHVVDSQLDDAHLEEASMQSTRWERASLKGAHLVKANLRGANLTGTKLQKAHLQGAKAREATLEHADLGQADLEDADFLRSNFTSARLSESHGPRVRLHGARLSYARFRDVHWEGANLTDAHLDGAYLARAHLEGAALPGADLHDANLREAHLEGADLHSAHFEHANLLGACLDGANLRSVHLEGVFLEKAHLGGQDVGEADLQRVRQALKARFFPNVLMPADLRGAFLDAGTNLRDTTLGSEQRGYITVADVSWGAANLAVLDWSHSQGSSRKRRNREAVLGDERRARQSKMPNGDGKSSRDRLLEYQAAVRANRQLAVALRNQGLNEDADRFAYRAQVLQRQVLRRQRQYGRAFGSWLLDRISGYGYRPSRSVVTYLLVILSFAAAYFALTNYALTPFLASHSSPLAWYEAGVLSVSSFHGRGLFPTGLSLGDPVAILAAFEAIFGLLIEITFIATFTQRFFAR